MNKIKKLKFSPQLVNIDDTERKNSNKLEMIHSLLLYRNKSITIYGTQIADIIPISSILYVKSSSNYSTFYLEDGKKIVTSKTLKYWENKIDSYFFLRCHNSYLINCKYVISFSLSKNNISLNEIKLPISRSRKNKLIEYFD